MRGQVFEIHGKKIFTMGGAYSRDRFLRQLGKSFWEEELPSNADYKEAANNLEKNGFSVDYIVSHTAPREIIRRMGFYPDQRDIELTGFLEWVMYETTFSDWYFGHWHIDRDYGNMHALWFRTIEKN